MRVIVITVLSSDLTPRRGSATILREMSTGAGSSGLSEGSTLSQNGRSVRVGHLIGRGAFGEVFSGTELRGGTAVAVKIERLTTDAPQLRSEARFYEVLHAGGASNGICPKL